MLTLVSYDIVSDARRDRVANALKDFGRRVQYSVFECHLSGSELEALRERLSLLIDGTADSVRYYQICGACEGRIQVAGVGGYAAESRVVII